MTIALVAATLFLLLLVTLSLPVAFSARVHLAEGRPTGQGEVIWAWGLVRAIIATDQRVSIRLGPFSWFTLPPVRPRQKTGAERRTRGGNWLEPLTDGQLWQRTFAYLGALARVPGFKFRLEGEYGTGDPVLTGYLSALLAVIALGPLDLRLDPVFDEPYLDVRGELTGRLSPLKLIWLTLGFIIARPVRRLWWSGLTKRKTKS